MILRSRDASRNWQAGATVERGTVIVSLGAAALSGIVVAALAIMVESSTDNRTTLTVLRGADAARAACHSPAAPVRPCFYSEIERASMKIRAAMTVAPSGDVDRDFARVMISHRQGAVDLALIELRYGRDQRLRQLAQAIVATRDEEIAYMRSLIDPPTGAAAGTLARE